MGLYQQDGAFSEKHAYRRLAVRNAGGLCAILGLAAGHCSKSLESLVKANTITRKRRGCPFSTFSEEHNN